MRASGEASLDLRRLAEDVVAQLDRHSFGLDIVGFTGDLAWSGSDAEYRQVRSALEDFATRLPIAFDRLCLVPGNHDVDRKVAADDPCLQPLDDDPAVSRAYQEFASTAAGRRQAAYARFVESFHAAHAVDLRLDPGAPAYARNFTLEGVDVSVLCLNTAWLSRGDADHGRLALGEIQVRRVLDACRHRLRMCLMHHPFSWLRDHEEPVVHRLLTTQCQFILTGHQHIPRFAEAACADGAVLLSAGAAHVPARTLSYNLVHVDPDAGRGSVHTRLFSGHSPYWMDHEVSPHLTLDGRTQLVQLDRGWMLARRPPRELTPPAVGPEWRYSNLYQVATLRLPYIVLISSWTPGVHEYRRGDVEVQLDPSPYRLPADFLCESDPLPMPGEGKCRLVRYAWAIRTGGLPDTLQLTLGETCYRDYLLTGERLDAPIPNKTPPTTYRDSYAPEPASIHDFAASKLPNTCGVGVFILCRDNKLILSQHSSHVAVYAGAWSYSASGTMDWSAAPHPFSEVTRECFEEIRHRISEEDLRLFGLGIDTKKFYFQFSFLERSARDSSEVMRASRQARDFSKEMERLLVVPFQLDALVELLKAKRWEPAAAAALLTLCAKEFGLPALESAIDPPYIRRRWREEMSAAWRQRAERGGVFAVMSARYPAHRCEEESGNYVDAVMDFLGHDLDGQDVLEVGCGNGRLTRALVQRVRRLTCLDLSDEMLYMNRQLLSERANTVTYVRSFLQDYQPANRHAFGISSLVLIHNADDDAFIQAAHALDRAARTLFLFEHVADENTPAPDQSSATSVRREEHLLGAFPGFRVTRRRVYPLFDDQILFVKLERRGSADT